MTRTNSVLNFFLHANSLNFALNFPRELEFSKRAPLDVAGSFDGCLARNKREQTIYNLSINRVRTRFINAPPVHGPRHSANIRRRIFRAVRRSADRNRGYYETLIIPDNEIP